MICLEKELTICYTSSGDTISRYNSRQTRLLTIYIWLDLFKCRECVYYVHIYKIRTILQKFQHNQSELNNFFKLHYVFFVCNLILYINVVRGIKIPITNLIWCLPDVGEGSNHVSWALYKREFKWVAIQLRSIIGGVEW